MLKNWVTYYIFLLASLAFALLYPGRASSAIFYVLLLLPPASLAFLALMLAGLRYEQRVDRFSAVKGDAVHYRLTVLNRGLLMLPYVEVSFYGGDSIHRNELAPARVSVPPRGRCALDITLTCRYKGAYELGLRQLRIKDFLGLFSFRQDMEKLGTLVVYPRIVPIESFLVTAGYEGDARAADRLNLENAETVSEIRKYASGDRLRSIHWKLTAKREELMVKNFEKISGAATELMLDAELGGRKGEDALALEDKLVECAVSLAHHFASRSIPSTLHYSAGALVKCRMNGMGDFQPVYTLLSETSFALSCSLPDIAAMALEDGVRHKTVVIVSADLTERLCGEALKLRDSGCFVALVSVEDGKSAGDESLRAGESLLKAGVPRYCIGLGADIGEALARGVAG
jgi:hypothetical protein